MRRERDTCPECGSTDLIARSLPESGTVLTFTEISTTIGNVEDETPHTVVTVELVEDLRQTGQIRGGDGAGIGDEVAVGIERRDESEDVVTFHWGQWRPFQPTVWRRSAGRATDR